MKAAIFLHDNVVMNAAVPVDNIYDLRLPQPDNKNRRCAEFCACIPCLLVLGIEFGFSILRSLCSGRAARRRFDCGPSLAITFMLVVCMSHVPGTYSIFFCRNVMLCHHRE